MWAKIVSSVCLTGIALSSWAGPNDPIISAAWIGESVPGQATVTLQLNLTTIKSVKLLAVTSPVAQSIEIHNLMKHKGEIKVQLVPSLNLPDHRTIIFGTKGLFLMMTGLNQTLNIGDTVPLSLKFAFADQTIKTISANAVVKKTDLSYKHYGTKEIYDHR